MQEQIGDELYKEDVNYFDRGHMVRRKDPCWGEDYEYNAGNLDSMYFTNIAPQYYKVNQVCLQLIFKYAHTRFSVPRDLGSRYVQQYVYQISPFCATMALSPAMQ